MRFKVKVTGHAPPFKWELYAQIPTDGDGTWKQAEVMETHMTESGSNRDGTTIKTEKVKCGGEAPTHEEAMYDAREAAAQFAFEWNHQRTVHEEEFELFDIDEAINSIPDAI